MKWINLIILVSLLSLFVFSSCSKMGGIEGNNNLSSETRRQVSFNEVVNEDIFYVTIVPDTIYEVVIEAESNLIPYIRTIVNGNSLVIDTRENLDPNHTIYITVKTPTLKGAYLSGSGNVSVEDFNTDQLHVILSGSGTMNGNGLAGYFKAVLSGSGSIDFLVDAERVETTLSGSGNIRLDGETVYTNHLVSGSGNVDTYGLGSVESDAKISGSGNMYLTVSDVLNATISGSGSIFYRGTPVVNTNITGSGAVIGN